MEQFLNISWVFIAVSALVVWRTVWARQTRLQHRGRLWEWTAFACALVLLFFAVSLTDDLHSDLVIFDECGSGRRSSVISVGPHSGHSSTDAAPQPVVATLSPALFFGVLRAEGGADQHAASTNSSPQIDRTSGRAPPTFLL